jgi:predicted ArsR family transcriptional regulator
MARTVKVDDETILSKFSEIEGPVCTVPDLAELLPLKADGIRHRLKKLEDEGRVNSRKIGARATVWWQPD